MATRQNSSNGKQKSPRIQVVLPEDLCERLSVLAETESRTVSNMAKVLIQEGVKNHELRESESSGSKELKTQTTKTQNFINALEKQKTQRLKGIPKRLKFKRD
jgi:predicted DNA-binding protein